MGSASNCDWDAGWVLVFEFWFELEAGRGMEDAEKLSSERQLLSRRNAADASRRAVCRRTIASSIKPR